MFCWLVGFWFWFFCLLVLLLFLSYQCGRKKIHENNFWASTSKWAKATSAAVVIRERLCGEVTRWEEAHLWHQIFGIFFFCLFVFSNIDLSCLKTRRLCCQHFMYIFKAGATFLSRRMSGNQGESGLQEILCTLMPTTWTYWSKQQAVPSINGINGMVCPGPCHIWQMFWGPSHSLSALCIAPYICLWKLKAEFIPSLNPKISSHT